MTTVMNRDSGEKTALLDVSMTAGPTLVIAKVSGEVDPGTVGQLREALVSQLPPDARKVIVELSGLRFTGSLGIHVLLDAARMCAERGGSLALVSPQPIVARMLNLTGADQLVSVYRTAGEALEPR